MFQKFMNKKDFHPGSKWNIKRVWMAEQKQSAEEQKEKELAEQYKKEQDKFENRQLVSKDEKLKLGLSFIYDAPPGFKDKKKEGELSEPKEEEEVKFEWLKGAPKEAYTKDLNLETHAQPFGIPVRNVRCIKCHKWGHVNTDRECPLRNTTISSEPSAIADAAVSDPLKLMQDMRNDGLALKQNALGRVLNKDHPNQQYVASDDENNDNNDSNDDPELAFLATLNEKQKRKLLRKLNKLENKKQAKKKKKNSSESEEGRKVKHEKITNYKKYDESNSSESERRNEHRIKKKRKDDERNERERSEKPSIGRRQNDEQHDGHLKTKKRKKDKERRDEDNKYNQKEKERNKKSNFYLKGKTSTGRERK